jgi:alcohol dehydrogenase class IV
MNKEVLMKAFYFSGIRPVIFGVDRVDQLPGDIKALNGQSSEVLIISDAGLAKAGVVQRLTSILEKSGLNVTVFSELAGEPHGAVIDQAAAILRGMIQPCVLGVGGGSALDVAKMAALVTEAETPAERYTLRQNPLPEPRLKRILIPTTAGTGSEVTCTATFYDGSGRKVWAWGQALFADLVILDPSLTVTLPSDLTASTGLDALVHAIEAFTCRQQSPMSDALALHAIRLIAKHLLVAIEKPADIDARSNMLVASTLAGCAFAQTGTAAAHSIGHALATIAGIPHGRAVTIGMDALLAWNAKAAPEAHAAVAEALGASKVADQAGPAFRKLVELTGLELSLVDAGIQPESLAEVMMSEENLPMIKNNIRSIGADEALTISRNILR